MPEPLETILELVKVNRLGAVPVCLLYVFRRVVFSGNTFQWDLVLWVIKVVEMEDGRGDGDRDPGGGGVEG